MEKIIFDRLVDKRLELIKSTLQKKGEEYQSDSDVHHNFKQAAIFNHLLTGDTNDSPKKALIGMLNKHLVSIADMLRAGGLSYPDTYIKEKFGDVINYFIILETMFLENAIVMEEDCKCSKITN